MSSSRIPAFYDMSVDERRQKLAEALGLSAEDVDVLAAADALPLEIADTMVENAVGTFALPFGVALNFQINGRDRVIPMVVEEPSVIAAASNAALVARTGGGFAVEADPGAMIGQIQLVQVPDPGAAVERLGAARARLLERRRRADAGARAVAAPARATSRCGWSARRAARPWSSSTSSSTPATRWAPTPSTRWSRGWRRWWRRSRAASSV